MKKIVFLISDISNIGGTQKVVSLLANAFMEKLNYQVFIYSLQLKQATVHVKLNPKVKVINLNSQFSLFQLPSLVIEINNVSPDVGRTGST